jgi:hypothetical protein
MSWGIDSLYILLQVCTVNDMLWHFRSDEPRTFLQHVLDLK